MRNCWLCISLLITGMVNANPLNDPTRPPGARAVAAASSEQQSLPSLQAVFVGEQAGAILNQQYLALGEARNGYRLQRVEADAVVVLFNSQQYRLRLDRVSVIETAPKGNEQ